MGLYAGLKTYMLGPSGGQLSWSSREPHKIGQANLSYKTKPLVFGHMAEISARYRRENDRTGAARLFCLDNIMGSTHGFDTWVRPMDGSNF